MAYFLPHAPEGRPITRASQSAQNRWESLQQKVTFLLSNPTCRVRQFMSLIRLLTTTEKRVPLGRLHMRPIQTHGRKGHGSENWEKEISVPRSLHPHLQWWTQETNVLPGQTLHPLRHPLQVIRDASSEGWGAHLGGFTASRSWSIPECHLHITGVKSSLADLKKV